jgi:hypothetical protein
MLTLIIIWGLVLPVCILVFYVVQKSKPQRFRLSATAFKLISITVEVDGPSEPDQLSSGPQPGS